MCNNNFDKLFNSIMEDVDTAGSVYGNDGAYDTSDSRNFFPQIKGKRHKKRKIKMLRRKRSHEM